MAVYRDYEIECFGSRHGKYGTDYKFGLCLYTNSKKNAISFAKEVICTYSMEEIRNLCRKDHDREFLEFSCCGEPIDGEANTYKSVSWDNATFDQRYSYCDMWLFKAEIL